MAEILNLGQARKEKKRLKERAQADQNAVKFGRSKAEREALEKAAQKARRDLDGHQRE